MAKIPLKSIRILTIALIFFCATTLTVMGIDPENALNDPKVEKVEKADKEISEKRLKIDSVKAPENGLKEGQPSNKSTQEVKKQKSSTLSYNFVFYLMYKFKINEIFNLDKKDDIILIPNNGTMLSKSKKWVMELIQSVAF